MIYISQLLNKNVYYQNSYFGKIIDMAVSEKRPIPPVSKVVVKINGKKTTLPTSAFSFEKDKVILKTREVPFLPYDENDFYLSEDLLDKQVIDVNGKRLVRVNDVVMESNGQLKVVGIDVGFSGVLRRLGIPNSMLSKTKTLPWALIEAFDYQTGEIKILLKEDRLNTFHPSELADILEETGTKERIGIVEQLDAQKAAMTIEEANTQTQLSILEQLSQTHLKNITSKMLASEIADVFYKINPLRLKDILGFIGQEKAQNVQKLLMYDEDTAGGIMRTFFYQTTGTKTVKETLHDFSNQKIQPEAIVITNENGKVEGIVYSKHLLNLDSLALLKDVISERKFVSPQRSFFDLIKIFAQYNLRILPVVDADKNPIGIVSVDDLLKKIEEQKEAYESI